MCFLFWIFTGEAFERATKRNSQLSSSFEYLHKSHRYGWCSAMVFGAIQLIVQLLSANQWIDFECKYIKNFHYQSLVRSFQIFSFNGAWIEEMLSSTDQLCKSIQFIIWNLRGHSELVWMAFFVPNAGNSILIPTVDIADCHCSFWFSHTSFAISAACNWCKMRLISSTYVFISNWFIDIEMNDDRNHTFP